MTREEAKKQIEAFRTCMIVDNAESYVVEALNMAVEALEQEAKMGHWIKGTPKYKFNLFGDKVEVANYECSECGRIINDIDCVGNQVLLNHLSDFPYCHCGAKWKVRWSDVRIYSG